MEYLIKKSLIKKIIHVTNHVKKRLKSEISTKKTTNFI
jgi:hypothetical protein